MSSPWKKVADLPIGGLTEVGFDPGSSLLVVVSHQGRGVFSLATGDRVARDRDETDDWFDALRPAVLGIGPLSGQWIDVAGIAGGQLPAVTADGWQIRPAARGVELTGPAGESLAVNESEEMRAFGFSPDGVSFVIAASPSLAIFRRERGQGGSGLLVCGAVPSTPLTMHRASVSVLSRVIASAGPVTRVSRVPPNSVIRA